MISGFLPGQEEGNVSHVVDGRMGCFCKDTATLAENLTEWLDHPDMLRSMSRAARGAGRPRASLDIAQDILQIMKRHPRNNATCVNDAVEDDKEAEAGLDPAIAQWMTTGPYPGAASDEAPA